MGAEAFQWLIAMQKGEITEHGIYSGLAAAAKDARNREILSGIAGDELRHYGILKEITGKEFPPDSLRAKWFTLLARVLGVSFALKLMENGEAGAQQKYAALAGEYPKVRELIEDEERHEASLLAMLADERLEYASSIVLGLNDALVELTGALAGLTLAFQNGTFIAVSGLVIGIAAALSMAASSYLSSREEGKASKAPLKSAAYTGVTYMATVLLLVSPYFLAGNVYLALAAMMAIAMIVIAGYTFYVSVAKGHPFFSRFAEMAAISLAVAGVSFAAGYVARVAFGLSA